MTGEAIHLDSNGQAIHLQGESAAGGSGRRADARRNRDKILSAARAAFSEGGETSMAEISRRAGVGMATLYRNFPSRRELLEAVYADEVAALCAAAATDSGESPGEALRTWLLHFAAFITAKRDVATELLTQLGTDESVMHEGRAAGLAAGRPLLDAAQRSGEVRGDLTLEQIFDLVVAVATIHADPDYVAPILRTALDGLTTPAAPRC